MSARLDPEAELDRLYAGDPDDFVAGRDELAKALRKAGEGDEAKAVKALRRPTRPAAAVNWLVQERGQELSALSDVAARLRDPDVAADSGKLRETVAEQREAIEALVEEARCELERREASAGAIERVEETLRAAASDPEVEEVVLAGRLDREREASTIGFALGAGAVRPKAKRSSKGERPKSLKGKGAEAEKKSGPTKAELRKQVTAAKRVVEAAEEGVEEARARLEEAESELNAANSGLREAKAEAKRARETLHAAQRRAAKA